MRLEPPQGGWPAAAGGAFFCFSAMAPILWIRENQAFLNEIPELSESVGPARRLVCWCCPTTRQIREKAMPMIEVHVIKDVFSTEQKTSIIKKLTDAMVSIGGENMRGVTWVKIHEVASGDWAIGGQPLTTQAVRDLAAGKNAA